MIRFLAIIEPMFFGAVFLRLKKRCDNRTALHFLFSSPEGWPIYHPNLFSVFAPNVVQKNRHLLAKKKRLCHMWRKRRFGVCKRALLESRFHISGSEQNGVRIATRSMDVGVRVSKATKY